MANPHFQSYPSFLAKFLVSPPSESVLEGPTPPPIYKRRGRGSNYAFPNMSARYYHVTHAFQSESTLCSCMNVKELLARNKYDIRSLIDSNRIRIHNHLVCKRTLSHLAKRVK